MQGYQQIGGCSVASVVALDPQSLLICPASHSRIQQPQNGLPVFARGIPIHTVGKLTRAIRLCIVGGHQFFGGRAVSVTLDCQQAQIYQQLMTRIERRFFRLTFRRWRKQLRNRSIVRNLETIERETKSLDLFAWAEQQANQENAK